MKLTGIPMVPSLNMAYPTGKNGRRFKSEEFRIWERDFRLWCFSNSRQVNEARQSFSQIRKSHVVRIDCEFFFPRTQIITKDGRPKRNDTSNRLKILHDGISTAIWLDDCVFFDGSFIKRPIEEGQAYCDVELTWVKVEWMNA